MTSSIQDLFKFGWQKTKGDFWFLFLVEVAGMVITAAVSYPRGFFPGLLAVIVGVFMSVSLITLALRMTDDGVGTWHDLFAKYHDWRLFRTYVVATLIDLVIVMAGFALLVLPGIYVALRLSFYKFAVIDKDGIGALDSLKESWEMTRGMFWRILGLVLAAFFLNLAGFLALGVGLFVTLPVTVFAFTKLYRELSARVLPQAA